MTSKKSSKTLHEVKYVGQGSAVTRRIITVAEAEAASFVLAEDLVLEPANRHRRRIEDLDESALEYLNEDPDFEVKELQSADDPEDELTDREKADHDAIVPHVGAVEGDQVSEATPAAAGTTGAGATGSANTAGGGSATANTATS